MIKYQMHMKTLLIALIGLAGFGLSTPSADARDNGRYRGRDHDRHSHYHQHRYHHHHHPRVVYYRSGPRYVYEDGCSYTPAPRRVIRPGGVSFFFRF